MRVSRESTHRVQTAPARQSLAVPKRAGEDFPGCPTLSGAALPNWSFGNRKAIKVVIQNPECFRGEDLATERLTLRAGLCDTRLLGEVPRSGPGLAFPLGMTAKKLNRKREMTQKQAALVATSRSEF